MAGAAAGAGRSATQLPPSGVPCAVRRQLYNVQHRRVQPQRAAVGIAGKLTSLDDALQLLSSIHKAAVPHASLYALELLLVGTAVYAAAVWPSRPRGWCFKELVAVRPSPIAGKGVFATVHIQEGTTLGAYPGRPRTQHEMALKCQVVPVAGGYCFKTRSGLLLDPTDASGCLSSSPAPGLPWLPIDYTLAYVNEPPRGAGGTSLRVEDDPRDDCGLLCLAARDIDPGEELFLDYGIHYDRSMYGQQQQQQQQQGDVSGSGAREEAGAERQLQQ